MVGLTGVIVSFLSGFVEISILEPSDVVLMLLRFRFDYRVDVLLLCGDGCFEFSGKKNRGSATADNLLRVGPLSVKIMLLS